LTPKNRTILGIDPGTTVMGYGIIEVVNNEPKCVILGILELKKFDDHFTRLKQIYDRVAGLITQYKPDEMAIEAPFFGKNVQSMLKLGRAQGTAIAAGLAANLPITEYAPLKIKMSITGSGSASKEQVAFMLTKYLNLTDLPQKLDATDGLAAALCHYFQTRHTTPESKTFKSWKDFINQNPKRAK